MIWPFSRRKQPPPAVRVIQARYDAAQSTDTNRRHWSYTDALSARQANSPDVRKVLRERARYETSNNCYASGMIAAVADVVIGAGPQLQLPRDYTRTTRQQRLDNQLVERLFDDWAAETGFGHKLWTGRVAKAVDGEGCGLLRTRILEQSPVQLTLQLLETEQFTHGLSIDFADPSQVDGVDLDDAGEVVGYRVLRQHPSETYEDTAPVAVPAAEAFIWFDSRRPGQQRGVPEITPALDLFGQLRRFILATLNAAEFAASPAGVISTDAPPNVDSQDSVMDRVEYERGALLTLPNATKLMQLEAEHPNSTFREFVECLLIQIGRCLNLPRAIALGDASEYNYASGRLDHQAFERSVAVQQQQLADTVLCKVWRAWLLEAQRISGYLPQGWRSEDALLIRPRWIWQTKGHVDREKEAQGAILELDAGMTTLAAECAARGRDWEEVREQRALEKEGDDGTTTTQSESDQSIAEAE